MALKSSREGLRKELVDYLGNIIIDDNLRNEIIKVVDDKFVTPEVLNENVNNLMMQITTESGERIDGDDTLQNNINDEAIARQNAITNLEELIANGTLKNNLLWTNASPTSSFSAQTVSLDLSNYKFVYIAINKRTGNATNIDNALLMNIVGQRKTILDYLGSVGSYSRIIIVQENGIQFEDEHSNNYDGPVENQYLIPSHIYGIK